jgi:hypothetical protein
VRIRHLYGQENQGRGLHGDRGCSEFNRLFNWMRRDKGCQSKMHVSHVSVACPRVHAHRDYMVYMFDDGFSFDLGGQQPSGGVVAIYDIMSEKEVAGHK